MPDKPSTRPGHRPKNAHVREEVKPSAEVTDLQLKAAQAQRLKDDPAFIDATSAVKNELIHQIESLVQDGSPETDELERELCRTLRTLNGVTRALTKAHNKQSLREHNFRPTAKVEGEANG